MHFQKICNEFSLLIHRESVYWLLILFKQKLVLSAKRQRNGGYLDIGLYDTMKDLFVNFIGDVVFSVIGFVYARGRGKRSVISLFVPRKKAKDRDYLSITNKKLKWSVFFDNLNFQIIEFYLFYKTILVKSRFGMTLKVRNGTVKPDGIFQVKFIADLFQAAEWRIFYVSFMGKNMEK